jgi:hypothetical protein
MFAALEHLSDDYINRVRVSSKENIKTSAKESLGLHELKQHKSLLTINYYRTTQHFCTMVSFIVLLLNQG